MRQRDIDPKSVQELQRPATVEDLNRAAAAQRAWLREGIEWIEDPRSQPSRTWLHSLGVH